MHFKTIKMKKILASIILTISSLALFAQDKTTDELKILSDTGQYDRIIEQHAPKSKEYSARSLYYIGLAYYMKEDDNNCIQFVNSSIQKNPKDPAPHYIKASTLNYLERYGDAVKSFQTAISLKPDDAIFYSGLGDSYYQLKNNKLALENYIKATEQKNCLDRPYSMIAQIYFNLKENEKALEAFYVAKSKITKESNSYINALFNIGLLESLNGNYEKAEPIFIELIQLSPDDYHSYAKLIQIYYHYKQYDKAASYRDNLYEAHKKGLLKDNMEDMFCFDQFKWKDYSIQVFERYENENKGKIYNKHLFYVIDKNNEIVLRAQTEFSPISIELNGPKYILCANVGSIHFNSGRGFNDDFIYDNLKAEALKLIEKHLR